MPIFIDYRVSDAEGDIEDVGLTLFQDEDTQRFCVRMNQGSQEITLAVDNVAELCEALNSVVQAMPKT